MHVSIVGPVGLDRFVLDKTCQTNELQAHNYDHATIVCRGALAAIIDGVQSRRYESGEAIAIAAGKTHILKALEDNTVYVCAFSHRDFDGLVTQTYIGNEAAYA